MLPFVLASSAGFEIDIVVVVFRSSVERFGMIAYLKLAPRVVRNRTPAWIDVPAGQEEPYARMCRTCRTC